MVAGVAAAGVAMVWLLKDRILGPETTPVTAEQAPRFRVVPSLKPGRKSDRGDDLSEIKGIGPVYKARLADGGVTTFSTLARTDPARLAEIAEVGEETAAAWVKQASTLAG